MAQGLAVYSAGPYRQAVSDSPEHTNPSSVRVSSTSYRVHVIAEDRPDVALDGMAEVAVDGPCTTIDSVASTLTVRVPEGTDVVIGSGSGRVDVSGDVGDLAVLTDSGRIKIEQAASVDARTRTARIEIGRSDGECRVRSESGRVEVDACCGADVATNSGRISLRQVDGPVHVHCVSGRVHVEMVAAHDVEAETVSGRVEVSLPSGVKAWESTDATATSVAPVGCDCTVNARSVTGRVDVLSG